MRRAVSVVVAAALVGVVGCGDDGGPVRVDGIEVPDGFDVGLAIDGLVGPTQVASDGTGGVVVAELNGGEDDGTGRVVRYRELSPDAAEVLVEGLLKPTGVAIDTNGTLWIMEQRRLTAGPLSDPSDRTVVLDEMPFNGRSQGTITPLDDGGVLYDTSGSRDRDVPEELRPGSGSLWFLSGPEATPIEYATGFKHAYAHTVDADGQLWSTEMSDGRLDGDVPPDELVRVSEGDDFGYPRCIGDRTPVAELGADGTDCDSTPPSHVLFEPRATPTGVAVAPWDPDTLLVALWNRAEIVAIPRDATPGTAISTPIVTGDLTPQHLLADADRLLVTDFAGGRILVIARS